MTLGKGTLAKGSIAGTISPPLDGLLITVDEPRGSASTIRPTIRWSHTPLTSIQTQWQVTIDLAGQNVYATGFVTGAEQQHQVTDPLSAGATYNVRVNIITDFPSSAAGQSSFTIETPDLNDQVGRPFLLHTAELLTDVRAIS